MIDPDDGYILNVSLENAHMVPLPAGLPLVLTGLGALAVFRRRTA